MMPSLLNVLRDFVFIWFKTFLPVDWFRWKIDIDDHVVLTQSFDLSAMTSMRWHFELCRERQRDEWSSTRDDGLDARKFPAAFPTCSSETARRRVYHHSGPSSIMKTAVDISAKEARSSTGRRRDRWITRKDEEEKKLKKRCQGKEKEENCYDNNPKNILLSRRESFFFTQSSFDIQKENVAE